MNLKTSETAVRFVQEAKLPPLSKACRRQFRSTTPYPEQRIELKHFSRKVSIDSDLLEAVRNEIGRSRWLTWQPTYELCRTRMFFTRPAQHH
jgi:hypothetical protein